MNERVTLCSATLGEDGKREPPLGPLYIAGALESLGVEVDFRDYQLAPGADGFSSRHLAEFLGDHAEIVAVSCFVDMLPVVIDATRRLREANPETTIVLGGPGPSASADRILESIPGSTPWSGARGKRPSPNGGSEGGPVGTTWNRSRA